RAEYADRSGALYEQGPQGRGRPSRQRSEKARRGRQRARGADPETADRRFHRSEAPVEPCSPTRTASSRICTGSTIGASKARAAAAPGTALKRFWPKAATDWSTSARPRASAAAAAPALPPV